MMPILIITVLCFQPFLALASGDVSTEIDVYTPEYEYIDDTDVKLTITSGVAKVEGKLNGIAGVTDKVIIYLYLQRLENGTWKNVKTYSQISHSHRGSITQYHTVSSGYTYRVRGSLYAYDGTNHEHVSKNSASVYY